MQPNDLLINRYRLNKSIGRGSFVQVWMAIRGNRKEKFTPKGFRVVMATMRLVIIGAQLGALLPSGDPASGLPMEKIYVETIGPQPLIMIAAYRLHISYRFNLLMYVIVWLHYAVQGLLFVQS